jgi:MFS family permease
LLSVVYVSSIFAPIVGILLLEANMFDAMTILIFIFVLALLLALIVVKRIKGQSIEKKSKFVQSINVINELRSWNVIWKSASPALASMFTLNLVEASYWTLGGLFGLSLIENDNYGWLPMLLYIIPMIIGSFTLSRLHLKKGKKKIANRAILLGGLALVPLYFILDNDVLVLLFIFLSGLGYATAKPLNYAVVSELMGRIGRHKQDLIGLQNSLGSLAFIIAPMSVGYLADLMGYQFTFASVGLLSAIVAVMLILTTPKKLKMPLAELEKIDRMV